MKTNFLSDFDSIPYFTIEGVKQLMGDSMTSSNSIRTAIYRWMKRGQLIQLKKGVYMTRHFYDLHHADEYFSQAISAILIPQSYVSLEYVLLRESILTEVTYPVSSVTIKHTRVIENNFGTFAYRSIRADLYKGFTILNYMGIPFSLASPAKALFDFLYFRPLRRRTLPNGYSLSEELRLKLENFSEKDQDEFTSYVKDAGSNKMEIILENLRSTSWQH